MVLAGLGILAGFVHWEERRHRLGLDRLLDPALLKITQLRAGLTTLMGQQLVLMGLFFVVPVYLQVVVGLDAFETGKRLLPLSAAMLVIGDGRSQGRGEALAEDGRAGGPGPDQRRGRGDARHARREAQRHRVQDRHGPDRRRRWAPRLAARQRDHVVDRPVQGQRDGGPAGNGPEPRGLDRHRPDRRDPDPQPDQRVQRQHRRQPAGARPGARDDRHQHGGGHRHRAGRPGRATGALEGPLGGPGEGGG